MTFTAARIEGIRLICYAALGAVFLGTGIYVLATGRIPDVPAPAYAGLGLTVAAVLFLVAAIAPRRAIESVYDEGSDRAWMRATSFGYWTGILCFAVLGNMASAGWIAVGPAFLASSTLTASAPFAHFLIGEWRRGR